MTPSPAVRHAKHAKAWLNTAFLRQLGCRDPAILARSAQNREGIRTILRSRCGPAFRPSLPRPTPKRPPMKRTILALLVLAFAAFFAAPLAAEEPAAGPADGQAAPYFKLEDQHFKWHTLADYSGKWVVLYFYPKDFTPGCTKEVC